MVHRPVLLQETIEYLTLSPGDIVFDGTLGGGGHTRSILEKILPGGKVIATDKDLETFKRTTEELKEYSGNTYLFNEDFCNIDRILQEVGVKGIDGAIFDLGMSSFQIDDATRGFSFLKEGPLDMRFDKNKGISAKDMVNQFAAGELEEIIRNYGEERHALLVSRAIVARRKKKRIETTKELADIVVASIGRKYYRQKIHAAARTFQGLRIYVNNELEAAREAVGKAVNLLKPNGRICVISFHSLEDRIIKNIFRDNSKLGNLKIITKKPITPERDEVRSNPRARSAKLRVGERIYETT